MENTKANVIKLLKELQQDALTMVKAFRESCIEAGVEHHKGKYLAYGTIINLLTDDDYFDYVSKAYNL